MVIHSPKTWGLSVDNYDKLGWGSAYGSFKAPNSVIKRFRLKDDNGADQGFDYNTAFNELAVTYINAIRLQYGILKVLPFSFIEGGMQLDKDKNIISEPDEGSDQSELRKVIYGAVEFAVANKQVWERINTSSISTTSFNVQQDPVTWLLTSSMLGTKALNALLNIRLQDYQYYDEDVFMQTSPKGNVKIIGKVSLDEIPELINE